jgi:HEPN domain-containing protein
MEKILKAHVCGYTKDLAPKLHNLVRLAQLSGLTLNEDQIGILAEMNSYNLEGRYPDMLLSAPTLKDAEAQISRAEKVYKWLLNQLPES